MRYFNKGPYWLTTRYATTGRDGAPIPKGTRVWYYPATKQMLVGEAAEQAARDFDAAVQDENFYNA